MGKKEKLFWEGYRWFIVGYAGSFGLHLIEINTHLFSRSWHYLENMKEGMGALLGSGSALMAAVGAVSLAHYFAIKKEKREAVVKRVNMILALKAEYVSIFFFLAALSRSFRFFTFNFL